MGMRGAKGEVLDWSALFEAAESQGGFFTTAQAEAANVGRRVLSYSTQVQKIRRVGRGIYRFERFPPTPHEELIPLWLWAAGEGVFSHETALALRNLSDVLPTGAVMTLPKSWETRRLKAPAGLLLHFADLERSDRTSLGPIPLTSVLRTLNDCAESGVEEQFLRQAVREAISREQLSRAQIGALHGSLKKYVRTIARTSR